MRGLFWRIRDLWRLVRRGHARKAWDSVSYRIYSDSTSLGMRRDLTVPFQAPAPKIPITVRPLAASDDLSALDPAAPGVSADEASWRLGQRRLLDSGISTCYVALAPTGKVCYMQWLMPPTENERLHAFFGNLYPVLGPDEALLEGAFTPDAFRGQGIMGAAMAHFSTQATAFGARSVITFVDELNPASVKGCMKAGFAPYVRRHETFRLFSRRVSFAPLPPDGAKSATPVDAA
jgi:hypothetical protein